MGFLLFLKLVATISDVLAWPLITLVYPLYASVRAIERNSLSDSKKCLTYWVICGLIMLFEMPFARMVHWIPFWPYVKLMFNLWLVVAHFDGAVYAYDHFIRPCFSVDLQTVGYCLRSKRNGYSTGNSDSFLLLAKRFVQENGSDGLEKLISDKVKCLQPKLAIGENNLLYFVNNKEITEQTRIKCEEPKLATEEKKPVHTGNNKEDTDQNRVEMMMTKSLAQSGHKEIATTESKPTAEAKVVVESSGVPQSSIAGNAQREWTCALCQVCVSSEITLANHLRGRKHKAKVEMIKTRAKQTPAKTLKEPKLFAKPIAERTPTITELASGTSESSILVQPPRKWKCTLCQIYLSKEASMQNHVQGKRHKEKEMEVLAKQLEDMKNNTVSASAAASVSLCDLYCHKCKLQCNSLSMLTDHLGGKRHLEGSKEDTS